MLGADACVATLALIAFFATASQASEPSAVAQRDAEADVQLIIRFEAAHASLVEFTSIMNGVEKGMQGEPGFRSALIFQNVDDPCVLTLVEHWQSRKSHEDHFDRIVASGAWAHILSLLRKEPDLGYFSRL